MRGDRFFRDAACFVPREEMKCSPLSLRFVSSISGVAGVCVRVLWVRCWGVLSSSHRRGRKKGGRERTVTCFYLALYTVLAPRFWCLLHAYSYVFNMRIFVKNARAENFLVTRPCFKQFSRSDTFLDQVQSHVCFSHVGKILPTSL